VGHAEYWALPAFPKEIPLGKFVKDCKWVKTAKEANRPFRGEQRENLQRIEPGTNKTSVVLKGMGGARVPDRNYLGAIWSWGRLRPGRGEEHETGEGSLQSTESLRNTIPSNKAMRNRFHYRKSRRSRGTGTDPLNHGLATSQKGLTTLKGREEGKMAEANVRRKAVSACMGREKTGSKRCTKARGSREIRGSLRAWLRVEQLRMLKTIEKSGGLKTGRPARLKRGAAKGGEEGRWGKTLIRTALGADNNLQRIYPGGI